MVKYTKEKYGGIIMDNKKSLFPSQKPRVTTPGRPVVSAARTKPIAASARPATAPTRVAVNGARPATATAKSATVAAKPTAVPVKPAASVAKPATVTAKSTVSPAATQPTTTPARPAAAPTNTASAEARPAATKSDKKSNKNLPLIIGACVAIVVLVVAIILAVAFSNRSQGEGANSGSESVGPTNNTSQTLAPTEEDDKTTKETLDQYAEVTIDGYQKVDDNEISSDVVPVHIKNISNETQSLAIIISAEDRDGNILDTSALYAEGIQPGDTQHFQAFVYTVMTPEQMQNATYKVYKASTYQAPTHEASENTEVTEAIETVEEIPTETPAETDAETIEVTPTDVTE